MSFGFVLLAVLAFLVLGTSLSNAGRLAASMKPFRSRVVTARVWGAPLPDAGAAAFRVDSVRAAGAGLLVYLSSTAGGDRILLKVAQPSGGAVEPTQVTIAEARYVQWAGTRIPSTAEGPALRLVAVE
jgi:hypothetical protein